MHVPTSRSVPFSASRGLAPPPHVPRSPVPTLHLAEASQSWQHTRRVAPTTTGLLFHQPLTPWRYFNHRKEGNSINQTPYLALRIHRPHGDTRGHSSHVLDPPSCLPSSTSRSTPLRPHIYENSPVQPPILRMRGFSCTSSSIPPRITPTRRRVM